MIAPLRRRHRWMTTTLAIVVPVLYVIALLARSDVPQVDALPSALANAPSEPGEVLIDGELFDEHPMMVRVRRGRSAWAVEIEPRQALIKPEVLVYWAPPGDVAEGLPAGAYLLGSLAGARTRVLTLPEAVLGRPGQLVLYSLGHQEVLDSATLAVIGAPAAAAPEAPPVTDEQEEAEATS